MSDPVTNAEVEDVLSSIRRLVSEEKRPVPAAQPAPRNDRLVLTPSLRIEGEEAAQEQHVAEEAVEFEDEMPASDAPGWATDAKGDVIETLEDDPFEHPGDASETSAQAQEAEDDYATDPYHFDDETDVDGESDAPLTLAPSARSDAPWPAIVSSDPETEKRSSAEQDGEVAETKAATLSAKIEALESAIGGIDDDFEPDEPDMDAYSGTSESAMTWEDDLEFKDQAEEDDTDVHQLDDSMRADVSTAEDDVAPEAVEAEAFHSSRAPAEEVAVEETDLPVEEKLVAHVAQESMQDARERIEEAVVAAATASDQVDDDQPFAFASDVPMIDEDALRDMVGDIVRAELQGALGERITRNVRKLVRREIHRALTTQDLE